MLVFCEEGIYLEMSFIYTEAKGTIPFHNLCVKFQWTFEWNDNANALENVPNI